MMQAFHQSKPERDTHYQQLELAYDEGKGWRVLWLGGTTWGEKGVKVISEVLVKDFDEGKVEYDNLYRQLQEAGWKPYTPYQTWD
jgi:hypothetical protein